MAYASNHVLLRDAETEIAERIGGESTAEVVAPMREARQQLLKALEDGAMPAEGELVESDPRTGAAVLMGWHPIPRDWWRMTEISWTACALTRESSGKVQMFRRVTMKMADVDRIWPPTGPVKRPSQGAFSSAAIEQWYKTRVENWRANVPPPSRDDDLRDPREAIATSVTIEAIRKVRQRFAPKTSKAQGRRAGSVKTGEPKTGGK